MSMSSDEAICVLSAEEEVAVYERGVTATGAKAVKLKIGGRMSRNLDHYPGRTEKLLRLAHKNLGDKITLYADANGSYDVPHGIRIGRLLEELTFAFFEEPCPYEELSETPAVAKSLRIPALTASRTTASGGSTGRCATA